VSSATLPPPPPPTSHADGPGPAGDGGTRKLIRGSSLLLAGRFISLAITLVVQVLVVRYLSKADFGAFAYGLGVASIGSTLVLLGLDKSASRFVPIFQERGEPRKAVGTVLFSAALVGAAGVSLVALCHGLQGAIAGNVVTDPRSLSLLLVLIVLAPVDALDSLLQGQLAIFVGPRAIFLRRHILAPGLKLSAVLLVILVAGDATLLAWGYVAGGLLGLSTYVAMLTRAWRAQGLLRHARPRSLEVPAREVLGYSMPLLSSELVLIMRGSFTVILLEYLQTTAAVAEYRAVLPFAKLNVLVLESFALLFIPVASRMFARGDMSRIDTLYWQTALWVAVFTFPAFAVMAALPEALTVLLFGTRYAEAAPVLAVLAVGYYVHAALGFNHYILRVQGHLRYIVTIDVVAALAGLALHLLLIPRYGALGAATATTATFILHKTLGQIGLVVCRTGVRPLDGRVGGVYGVIGGLALGLMLVQHAFGPPLWVGVLLVGAAWLALLRVTRRRMRMEETFPELLRVPLLGRLLR
jgi:O-antigen/teichoic acid export membrane protein